MYQPAFVDIGVAKWYFRSSQALPPRAVDRPTTPQMKRFQARDLKVTGTRRQARR